MRNGRELANGIATLVNGRASLVNGGRDARKGVCFT
nr:MAG TPA: hypothetical protein [Caudoviricetes sp.]